MRIDVKMVFDMISNMKEVMTAKQGNVIITYIFL